METQIEKTTAPHITRCTGNNEWYTPPHIIEAARAAMGSIDLDPASCAEANRIVGATAYYDAATDGLSCRWYGNVWLNPPYSRDLIGPFIRRACRGYTRKEYEQACVLVNNATETRWCQELLRSARLMCLPSQRLRFLDASGEPVNSPVMGQAVFYLGRRPGHFAAAFEEIGPVLSPL